MCRRFAPARSPAAQIKSFFAIDAPHSFVIVMPALAPQQDMGARHAVANTRGGDLFDALPDSLIISAVRFVINQRARQQTQRRSAFDGNAILVDKLFDELPPLFGS